LAPTCHSQGGPLHLLSFLSSSGGGLPGRPVTRKSLGRSLIFEHHFWIGKGRPSSCPLVFLVSPICVGATSPFFRVPWGESRDGTCASNRAVAVILSIPPASAIGPIRSAPPTFLYQPRIPLYPVFVEIVEVRPGLIRQLKHEARGPRTKIQRARHFGCRLRPKYR
jgi:hypothetical protein